MYVSPITTPVPWSKIDCSKMLAPGRMSMPVTLCYGITAATLREVLW